jgi:hypothetical protein
MTRAVYVLRVTTVQGSTATGRTRLVRQWRDVQAALPGDWSTAQLRLTLADVAAARRAGALLGPAQPFRPEPNVLRFASARGGGAPGPDAVIRLLGRLDEEGIGGTLELVAADEAAAPATVERVATLADAWRSELAKLPPDWSDLYAEIELLSTDYLERASVLCVPINPRRDGKRTALRFRAARVAGYGAAPEMVQRCLERCDRENIRGSVTVLRVLSDSHHVGTQGPVWILDGKTI